MKAGAAASGSKARGSVNTKESTMIPHEFKELSKQALVIWLAFIVGNAAFGAITVQDIFVATTLALGYGYGWWARTNHLNEKLQAAIDRRAQEEE
jgi:hypothetical protein